MRKLSLFLALFLSLMGIGQVWAGTGDTNFDDVTLVDPTLSYGSIYYGTKLSNGWIVQGGSIYNGGYTGNYFLQTTHKRGDSGLAIDASQSGSQTAYLITPAMSGDVTFWFKSTTSSSSSAWQINVYEATENGESFDIGTTDLIPSTTKHSGKGSQTWTQVTLSNVEGKNLAFVFYRVAIDDFEGNLFVETGCKKPKDLSASNLTINSADLSWTEGEEGQNAWQIVYSTDANFDKDNATPISVNTTSYSFTGLTPNTTYYVGVRSYCDADHQSIWASTSFRTEKVAVPAAGFIDDFETDKGWEFVVNGTSANTWVRGTAVNNGGTSAMYISNDGGTSNAYSTSGSMAAYASKLFAFEAGDYTIQYDWKANGESSYDFLRVALVPASDGLTADYSSIKSTALPSGWTELDGGSKLNQQTTWQNVNKEVTIAEAGNYQIVFAWRNDGSGGTNPPAAVDNFKILGSAPVLELGGDVVSNALDFGTVNGETVKTVTITNSGKVAMENITLTETADADNAFAYAALSKTTLAAGESMDVNVTFSPTTTKTYTGTFVVDADDVDAITVNVTATYSNAPATIAVNIGNVAVGGTVAFGEVGKQADKTFTVANDGDQTLNVTIASSNTTDFTVSPSALAVAGHTSETFTVTFLYDATALDVEKTANITVTPSNDGLSPVTFAVTGTRVDMWSEDFSGNTLPAGWDAGVNWTIANGVAKASYAYGTTNYLTTPTLTVTSATEELTFDYTATANYVTVKIQMSKDGGAFADYTGYPSSLNNGDTGTFTITGLSAGDYQFRFANDDYELDNFEGFKLNLADHICVISESTIPSSTSYSPTMKEGQSFDATVTVKENRGVAENLTAKLYAGTEVIGTATGSVAANGTTVLTINCTPTSTTTGTVMMHIEVEYAGGTLKTTNLSRYVAPLTYLTLDQTSSDAITAGTYDYVTLKRPFLANWNTVCLPFTISDVEEFFGVGASAYNFSSYSNGTVNFSKVTTLTASYPYIVFVPAAINDDIELTNITIASGDATPFYRYHDAVYFRGTYTPIAAGGWTKNANTDVIYVLSNAESKLMKAGTNASSKGFRGYFDVPASDAARLSISFDDVATGIGVFTTDGELEVGNMYNMQGQKVQHAGKGIYIINGKKVVLK